MENYSELLKALAVKLGTTTEYLFGILVAQAKVSAITSLIEIVFIYLFGFILYKTHKNFQNRGVYDEYEEGAGFPMFMALGIFAILFICTFFLFENAINGLFNPEYWALDKILSVVKK